MGATFFQFPNARTVDGVGFITHITKMNSMYIYI
jgi:hypothetical protein